MEKKEKSFLEELMPSLLFGIILLAVVLFFVMRNRAENRELQERRETEREQILSGRLRPYDEEGNYLTEKNLRLKDRWEEYGIGFVVLKAGYRGRIRSGEGDFNDISPMVPFLKKNDLAYEFYDNGALKALFDERPVIRQINRAVLDHLAENYDFISRNDGHYVLSNDRARMCVYLILGKSVEEPEYVFYDEAGRVIENKDLVFGSLLEVDAGQFINAVEEVEDAILDAAYAQEIPLWDYTGYHLDTIKGLINGAELSGDVITDDREEDYFQRIGKLKPTGGLKEGTLLRGLYVLRQTAGGPLRKYYIDLENHLFYEQDLVPHALAEGTEEGLRAMTDTYRIHLWDAVYDGEEKMSINKPYVWMYVFEATDGSMYAYQGETFEYTNVPPTFRAVEAVVSEALGVLDSDAADAFYSDLLKMKPNGGLKAGTRLSGMYVYRHSGGLPAKLNYFDMDHLLFYGNDMIPHDLREASAEKLRSIADLCRTDLWEADISDRDEEQYTNGSFVWKIVFVDENGGQYVYNGESYHFNNFPAGFEEFREIVEEAERKE